MEDIDNLHKTFLKISYNKNRYLDLLEDIENNNFIINNIKNIIIYYKNNLEYYKAYDFIE